MKILAESVTALAESGISNFSPISTDEIDGCIDFDLAVCDPLRPQAFANGYDSGDHLHPSLSAYKRMADEVPESILLK